VIIRQGTGTHFDPGVIEVFESLTDDVIERIRLQIG
jgi:response regulator RpfG family c-di-GMP phosphodiesterase